jgi:hypothetical protein
MNMYLRMALISSLLSVSVNCFSYAYNYVEYGVGAMQLHSLNSSDNDSLKNFSIGGAAKILIAGRLDQTANSWFELAFIQGSTISYQDTTVSNQFLSAGLKFTSNPYNDFSSFFKLGGSRVISNSTLVGEADITEYDSLMYLSGGVSLRVNNKQAINVEIQRFNQTDGDAGINHLFVTFNQSI